MTQAEVAKLASAGVVEEAVQFTANPRDRLVYVVETSTELNDPRAWISGQRIGITLPKHRVLIWAETGDVGIEHIHPITDTSGLRIVVEKDFRCLQPRVDEDESDNFPNLTEGLVSCKES
jgi:hypothetical protein